MQSRPPCMMLKKTLSWPFATVSFVCVFRFRMLWPQLWWPSQSTSVSQNKQAELDLSSVPSHLHPHACLLSCLMTEAGGAGGSSLKTRSSAGKMCLTSLGNTSWSWKSNKISAFLGEIRKPWLSTLYFRQFYLEMCFWKVSFLMRSRKELPCNLLRKTPKIHGFNRTTPPCPLEISWY